MGVFTVITLTSILLIGLSAAIFYEMLALLWVLLHKLEGRPRVQTILALMANFVAHTLAVWMFGAMFYGLHYFGFGELTGATTQAFMDYIYYSGGVYSSLGLENVGAKGHLLLLTVVESIMGLVMIGWTVAFSYIFANKYLLTMHDPDKAPRKD